MPSDYGWHFLSEGDSWFTIGAIPSSNLLFELRLAQWTQILNLAYPGDTIVRMGRLAGHDDLVKFLADSRFNYPWEGLLLSGGGNDLIDEAARIIRVDGPGRRSTNPSDFIDEAALQALMDEIVEGFRRILVLRDASSSKCARAPTFVHTYDYLTPRNAPARFLGGPGIRGPWLYPVFRDSGLDIALQQRICNTLIDRLAGALLEHDCRNPRGTDPWPSFHVVDTRNLLVMAHPAELGRSNDWLNEIHPTADGYRKIAHALAMRINEVLAAA
jgi:hypothetical protein